MILKNEIKYWLAFMVAISLISLWVHFLSEYSFLSSMRAILGTVYVLFLPGYIVVRCFYDDEDLVTKLALSLGLSIAIVILSITMANLIFSIPLTPITDFLILLFVMIATILIKKYNLELRSILNRKTKHKNLF